MVVAGPSRHGDCQGLAKGSKARCAYGTENANVKKDADRKIDNADRKIDNAAAAGREKTTSSNSRKLNLISNGKSSKRHSRSDKLKREAASMQQWHSNAPALHTIESPK